jgi:hypothetical protein
VVQFDAANGQLLRVLVLHHPVAPFLYATGTTVHWHCSRLLLTFQGLFTLTTKSCCAVPYNTMRHR